MIMVMRSHNFINYQTVIKIQLVDITNMKLPPLETSQTNIRVGLDIMAKVYTNAREWTGKFAQLQNQHQYPKDEKQRSKFGQVINKNLDKFKIGVGVCGLCQVEKTKSEMELLCSCIHSYCYSCLNSYAITKIEELVPVKCPLQECSATMQLTSNVYRYLPDSVKLKYLQNKHTFNVNKDEQANRCQRCLQLKHSGECKYALSPDLVQNSFKYRECPKCRVEIRLTSGKKKVSCSRCKMELCYLCGTTWTKGHTCEDKQKIRELERENGYHGCCPCCCECCSYGCDNTCAGCGNSCCRQCGNCCLADCCCEVLFYCQDPSIGCCLWNIFSIPVRLVLTLLALLVSSILMCCLFMILTFWILLCFVGGGIAIAFDKICTAPCPLALLMFLFFPFVYLYAVGVAIAETYQTPLEIIRDFCEMFCGVNESIWLELSPKRC